MLLVSTHEESGQKRITRRERAEADDTPSTLDDALVC
jgi:hypothetical protein